MIFFFLLYGPAHRSAQAGLQAGGAAEEAGLTAGPDRGQAGGGPEGAGLLTGPGRALARGVRPQCRPRPGARPEHGHGDRRWPPAKRRREREREEGRGRKPERRRSSPSWLGCPRRRRGWTETPESRPASDGRGREVEDDCVVSRRPRLDSTYGEGEEDATMFPIGFDSRGAAPIVGDKLGSYGGHGGAREEETYLDPEKRGGARRRE